MLIDPGAPTAVTSHDAPSLSAKTCRAVDKSIERRGLSRGRERIAAEVHLRRIERAPRDIDRIIDVRPVRVEITGRLSAARDIREWQSRAAEIGERKIGRPPHTRNSIGAHHDDTVRLIEIRNTEIEVVLAASEHAAKAPIVERRIASKALALDIARSS